MNDAITPTVPRGRRSAFTALGLLLIILGFGLVPITITADAATDCSNRFDVSDLCPTLRF